MELVAALTLDAVVVGILLCCVWQAAKKGFLRTILQMLAYIAVFAVSLSVARAAAPVLYDRVVEPTMFSSYLSQGVGFPDEQKDNAQLVSSASVQEPALLAMGGVERLLSPEEQEMDTKETPREFDETEMRNILGEIVGRLEQNGTELSGFLRDNLADLNPAKLEGIDLSALQELVDGRGELTLDDLIPPETQLELLQQIADQTVRPAATGIITMLTFAVTFGILSLIANILLGMLGFVRHLPLIGGVNAFFGGVVGLLQGMLLVWVLALLVYGVLRLTGGGWWVLSDSVVDRSFLFQYFIFPGLLGG